MFVILVVAAGRGYAGHGCRISCGYSNLRVEYGPNRSFEAQVRHFGKGCRHPNPAGVELGERPGGRGLEQPTGLKLQAEVQP